MNNNSQPTSNLDEILNIASSVEETDSSSSEDSLITNQTPTPAKPWSENAWARLLIVGGVLAVPALIFVTFYSAVFNNSVAGSNDNHSREVAVVTEEIQPELEQENIRGIAAIGEQGNYIKAIEKLKPDPTPKIKLEPITTEKEQKIEAIRPVATAPRPIAQPSTPSFQRQRRSSPVRVTPRPKPEVKYDSMTDWQQLALTGSYGGLNSSETKTSQKQKPVSVRDRFNQLSPSSTPTALLVSNQTSPQVYLSPSEASFLKALQQSKTSEETSENVAPDPQAQVAMAQQVEAKVATAINWSRGLDDSKQRTFIRLTEPLLNSKGEIAIAEDSMIVFEVSNINGGIVQGQASAIIVNGQEMPVPTGAIRLLNKKGEMLTAKYKEVKNGSGNRDLLNFALGAAEQTNNLVNRPNSSFSQISSLGQSQGTDYGDKNYPVSAVSGGATEVIKSRTQELENQRNNAPISSFWQVKQGTNVLIQIDRPFNY